MLNVKLYIRKCVLFVCLEGELDQSSAERMRTKISELIDGYNIRYLVLNALNLQFMDSSGIGFIIGRYNQLKKCNGEIIICNMNQQIKRIVTLSGLTKICVLKETEEDVEMYLGVLNEKIC